MNILTLRELFEAIQFEHDGARLKPRPFNSNKSLFPVYYDACSYTVIFP